MKVAFTSHSLPTSDAVCVGVTADRTLTASAQKLDQATDGALSRALKASARFTGDKQQLLEVLTPAGVENSRVLLVGLGKPDALDVGDLEAIGGELVAKLNAVGESQATFVLDALAGAPVTAPQAAARLALGARLRSYRFDKYRTQEKAEDKPSLTQFTVALSHKKDADNAYRPLEKLASGVETTRDLVSEPANVLTPEALAAECRKLEELGVEVEVLDAKAMRKLGMGALLAVAQGSDKEPKLVTMRWQGGSGKKTPLAVVGKGVCFDSGGISLKPAQGMGDMKWDMGGAGVTVGLMKALAGRKAKLNAVGVVGLVENMPGGAAYRPGDVLTTMSGQTVEVQNTDAEGRLVLADALWYAQQTYEPETMVNLATLTGAVLVALGNRRAGLFANDDTLAQQLTQAGESVGEKLWRLPMDDEYDKDVNSDIADMKNVGDGRNASSTAAAQFLRRFIQKGTKWAHLDIAGVTWSTKDAPIVPKGGTGFGVRLLDCFVADRFER
ncbi:leucyl aminopeptidase [Rhodovibrio salinarum]|uniref:Probable cytosol aminopeptidase n=1 Tax=Rhodovibrio salinarum TaxID=1087 RepID=A0A934QIP2_9PROT|nr:leucyl aminopeptidase [Rhodovibrio salinarum]MBK1697503.1 leucyl aminopeptidase [Rhodovibrio salinarum]